MATKDENIFTLTAFKKAADEKYGKLAVDLGGGKTTVLQSPLRISDANREKVLTLVDEFSAAEDASTEDDEQSLADLKELAPKFREFLTAVGDENTPKLLDAIGDDLAVLIEVFQAYQEKVGLGEA